jgi:hypothetical protein
MITFPEGTQGWLKYGGSQQWLLVEVLNQLAGTHTYEVRRSRTTFSVGNADILIVLTP